MARVLAKCTACGSEIKVNDEKITGFCSSCGASIDVAECIRLHGGAPCEDVPAPEVSTARRQARKEEREREANARVKSKEAAQTIHDMMQLCNTEQDFLMLRPKIMEMNIQTSEKAMLLEILDAATASRLKDTLEKAQRYEEAQESPSQTLMGCALIAAIGIGINLLFSKVWPGRICVGLAVIAVLGTFLKAKDAKDPALKHAKDLIEAYRSYGYRI